MKKVNNLNLTIDDTPEKLNQLYATTKQQSFLVLPKIVGDTKHYSPANKEWKTSIYAYNKNNVRSLTVLDKIANKTIKSYFNLASNKKLARSKRMRILIRRNTVKRLFVSRSEIKHTGDKVNLTVYIFNRERQFLLRKMYFFNRNMYLNKDIYLYKLWLKKNLLAFHKTFNSTELFKLRANIKNKKNSSRNKEWKIQTNSLRTKSQFLDKTYAHNVLLGKYLIESPKKLNIQNKSNLLNKIHYDVVKSIKKRNFIKSRKKRNFIRLLKKRSFMKSIYKREKKKLSFMFYSRMKLLNPNSKTLAIKNNLYYHKNYFAEKITKKVKFVLHKKHSFKKIKQNLYKLKRSRFGKIRLPYSNLKLKNEVKFFSFRLFSELKYIRKLFFFYFIKYMLNIFNIKVKIKKYNSRLSRLMYEFTTIEDIESKNEISSESKQEISRKNKKKNTYIKIKFINRYPSNILNGIEKLNLELLNFLKVILAEVTNSKSLTSFKGNAFNLDKINRLYKKFETSYFSAFLSKFFKEEFLYLNYYTKFLLNQLKFGKLLPGLKILISNIYSKKVELNLVSLKYPHLNSDIYADSIVTKLRKKIGLLKVIKSSLKLAKMPQKYYSNDNTANLNKLQNLSLYESLNINALNNKKTLFNKLDSSEDRLDTILNKLFPHSLTYESSKETYLLRSGKINEQSRNFNDQTFSFTLEGGAFKTATAKSIKVLNTIRYKWVSGVRLEAAGRLTRRYTAARSIFKFRYKGSLKNIDYSLKADPSKKNISTVMLRNSVKPNLQYSFTSSKKRIGAFGLKAWIGSY